MAVWGEVRTNKSLYINAKPPWYKFHKPLTDHIYKCVDAIKAKCPKTWIINTNDFNQYWDGTLKIVSSSNRIITKLTRKNTTLYKWYTNMHSLFKKHQVLGGLDKLNHEIIIVHPHLSDKFVLPKTYTTWTTQWKKPWFAYAHKELTWEPMYLMIKCEK